MNKPSKLIFLPGASGQTRFWQPVAAQLAYPAPTVHVGWPGFGGLPRDPGVHGLDDLVSMVVAEIDQPTALIAQSMGGVIALRAALGKPELVTHLVLCVSSGGIDLSPYDAQDWRPAMRAAQPDLPDWFASDRHDLAPRLGGLDIPTLLLWGDADPISPVPVGRRLASLLPRARLHVFAGAGHDLAAALASEVAPLIDRHLCTEHA